MTEIKVHSAAALFPMMTETEHRDLVQDIREHGLQTCIKLVGESRETALLIDGRNRLKAMVELGIDPYDYADVIHPDDLGDPVAYVLSLNLQRRHLNESQRAMVATKVANLKHGQRADTSIDVSQTQADAAEMLNVGVASVQRARKVTEHAVPEIIQAVERGTVSVSAAAEIAALPEIDQHAIASQGPKAIQEAAAEQRKNKWADGASSLPDVRESAPEDADSDNLFTLKKYWRKSKKKDKVSFQAFVDSEGTAKPKSWNISDDISRLRGLISKLCDNWVEEWDGQVISQFFRQCANEAAPAECEPSAPKKKIRPLGIGIELANEAIECLKRIPVDDASREQAREIVAAWIVENGGAE